ncbi:uncharacterized protein LJ206_003963 [Theristicus caerulescens]
MNKPAIRLMLQVTLSSAKGNLPPREKEESCECLQGWKTAPACWWSMQGGLPPNPCLLSPPPSCQQPGAAPSVFPVPPPSPRMTLAETTGNIPVDFKSLFLSQVLFHENKNPHQRLVSP